jgi:hypothetical protein
MAAKADSEVCSEPKLEYSAEEGAMCQVEVASKDYEGEMQAWEEVGESRRLGHQ